MNKMMKWGLSALLSLTLSGQAIAAFTVSGTRFIYDEGKKNVSVEVTNNADDIYGGQVWVDNISEGSGVYMVPTPPFFRISPKQKQIVRIMKTDGGTLPSDRESLFWLNVQEIRQAEDGRERAVGGHQHPGEAVLPLESPAAGRKNAE